MGYTITEKILGKACGKNVVPGEIVNIKVDKLMTMDFLGPIAFKLFEQLEAPKLYDPDMLVLIQDHLVPGHTVKDAEILKQFRDFAKKYNLQKNFYDIGRHGICHQMMVENGYAKPGKIVVGTDSHSTTYGAMGAFACGVSTSEAAVIMATGENWFRVPSTIKIELKGKLPFGVCGKDVSLKMMSILGYDRDALYKAVEVAGEGVASLEIGDRITICNMIAETGAKSGIIAADEKTVKYLKEIGADSDYEMVQSDPDAEYDAVYTINLDELVPTVALPHTSENIKPAEELEGTKINHVFIGSCTNGRLEDIKAAADILRGKKIAEDVRMIVVPATQKIYLESLKLGYVQDLIEAGAIFETSSCASCAALHTGILPSNEIAISTTNRNFKGRMGNPTASIYLSSAAVAAAAALNGYITDPRKYMV